MAFNIRFIIALVLIVLLILSFVLIIIEIYSFNNIKAYKLTKANVDVAFSDIGVNDTIKFEELGDSPNAIVSSTQHYRNLSVFIHILAMGTGVYLVYSS